MNDKCAGGTGAVIDKFNAKLKDPAGSNCCVSGLRGDASIHPVAGKCGVFAETDINGLQKQGIPPDELMASLFDAIVLQNLTVLTRGHTLHAPCAAPRRAEHLYRVLREAWRLRIPLLWDERGIKLPPDVTPEDAIKTPENASTTPPWARSSTARARRGEWADLGLGALSATLRRRRKETRLGRPRVDRFEERVRGFHANTDG